MKGIIMTTDSVRAILDGRKTKTRRCVDWRVLEAGTNWFWNPNENRCFAPYKPGDILYVKETWRPYDKAVGNGEAFRIKQFYAYKADEHDPSVQKPCEWYDGKWRSPMFMPRAAARLFLRMTYVRVERLREISDENAKAEGVNTGVGFEEKMRRSAIDRFRDRWDSINGKRKGGIFARERNPWVWAYTFERISKAEAEREAS